MDRVEPLVWEYVSGVMKDPEGLRADIDRMIELERGTRGDPGKEAGRWAEKLAEADRKRARYQEMAANDLITLDELRARLTELEDTRGIAERELAAVRGQEERVRDMERDRDALIGSLEAMAPEVLDSLTPEERHQWYKLLHLQASIRADGSVEVSWAGAPQGTAVCETASLPTTSNSMSVKPRPSTRSRGRPPACPVTPSGKPLAPIFSPTTAPLS